MCCGDRLIVSVSTDSSFVGKSSSGGMENEIDQEIEMMEMEDQLEDQDNE